MSTSGIPYRLVLRTPLEEAATLPLRAVAAHRVRRVTDRVFPFVEVPDAFRYVQAGGGFGKVVISHG